MVRPAARPDQLELGEQSCLTSFGGRPARLSSARLDSARLGPRWWPFDGPEARLVAW